ncbi:MAG: hypothetical protein H6581_21765 [Bacteroidia bacterium]|nr:hypothetical protein [Bacteroidia bacterium]
MKKTIILGAILLLLILFYFLFLHNSGGSSVNPAEIAFAIEDTAAVTEIEMQKMLKEQPAERLVLDKRPDGVWMINGKYVAQRGKVTNLLKTMNLLQLKENMTKEGRAASLERLKAYHILVTIKGKEGVLKEYLIGATNKEQTGNIMMLKGKDTPYIMSRGDMLGYVSIYYSTEVVNWRENLLFNIPLIDLQKVALEYADAGASFALERESPESNFTLTGNVPGDSTRISAYLSAFKGKTFAETFAGEANPGLLDSLKGRPADVRFYYDLFDGTTDTLRLYERPENPNNFFGWLSSGNDLLTVQHFVMDKFLRKKEYFALPTL